MTRSAVYSFIKITGGRATWYTLAICWAEQMRDWQQATQDALPKGRPPSPDLIEAWFDACLWSVEYPEEGRIT